MKIVRRFHLQVWLVLFAGSVFGQEDLSSFQEPDRVVVTGSLIPTAEEVTAAPLDTIGQREIERSGSVQVLEILQRRVADITGVGNLGPTNANAASGATQGGSSVAIRGLPTLALYEGRRIADSAAIAAGGFQFADVSIFPAALVSRIEVLKDGASALYGSDAVGGVINIFLKHDYKGVEIGYRYGFTPTSGTQNTLVYIVAGTGNDKTNITVGYQYYQSSGLFLRERDYANPSYGTTNFGGVIFDPSANQRQGQFYVLAPGLNSPFNVPGVTPGSQTSITTGSISTAYLPVPPSNDTPLQGMAVSRQFNLSQIPTSVLVQFNQNALISFTHQVYGKKLELFGDFLYTDNHSQSFLNPQPFTRIFVPAGHVNAGPDDPLPTIYNPFPYPITGDTSARPPNGLPYRVRNRYIGIPRQYTNETNFYRLLGGVRSQLSPDYSVESAFYYSNYHITYINSGELNGDQYQAMIAGTARDQSGNPIPSLDPFALNPIGTAPGQVSAAQFATIYGNNIRDQLSYQRVFDVKFTGFPFKLPAGPFGFALGGEHRRDGFGVHDTPEIFTDSAPIQEINADRGAYALYLELSIPLVSPSMKIPGIYSMDLTLAGRHEKYQNINTAANVPKVTFRYQPNKDLTLRATYSNSFVAPNLYQLYGPVYFAYDTSPQLPLGPGPNAQLGPLLDANEVTGRNPKLIPSTAQSYTAGAVYSPDWLKGLTISADYFNVLQQNVVGTLGSDRILQSVNQFVTASPYYTRVRLGSFRGPFVPASTPPFALATNVDDSFYIDNRNVNLGATRVTGWDFSISYTRELGRFGTLQLGANAVYYVNSDFRERPNSPYVNIKRTVGDEFFGNNPAYRVNGLAEYRYRNWTLGFAGTYNPSVVNILSDPSGPGGQQVVAAFFQTDARVSYTFVRPVPPAGSMVDGKGAPVRRPVVPKPRWYDGVTLTLGCNNMFNQQPPFVIHSNGNTDLATYDPYGRLVYFQASKKF